MGEKYFQEFGPIIFDMSSASGYMGAKYVQEFIPIFFDMSSAQGCPVPCRAQIWWIRAVPNISVPCPDDPCRAKYFRAVPS